MCLKWAMRLRYLEPAEMRIKTRNESKRLIVRLYTFRSPFKVIASMLILGDFKNWCIPPSIIFGELRQI